jgi:hypothetical protein
VFQRHLAYPPVWLNGHPFLLDHPLRFAASKESMSKQSSSKGRTV